MKLTIWLKPFKSMRLIAIAFVCLTWTGCAPRGGWPCRAWQKNTDQKNEKAGEEYLRTNTTPKVLLPPAATQITNDVVPHVVLIWNNNYLTNADGSTVSNEWTIVGATDALGEQLPWQTIGQTRDGFWVQPIDRPQRFFTVANIIK